MSDRRWRKVHLIIYLLIHVTGNNTAIDPFKKLTYRKWRNVYRSSGLWRDWAQLVSVDNYSTAHLSLTEQSKTVFIYYSLHVFVYYTYIQILFCMQKYWSIHKFLFIKSVYINHWRPFLEVTCTVTAWLSQLRHKPWAVRTSPSSWYAKVVWRLLN